MIPTPVAETAWLAQHECARCSGTGAVSGHRGLRVCHCIHKAVFRACWSRFRRCSERQRSVTQSTYCVQSRGAEHLTWQRLNEDYIADFCLVAKRHLTDRQWKVFRMHILAGADWRACCAVIGIDRGDFFHEVYRIQILLGKVFLELQPYALFPLENYFVAHSVPPQLWALMGAHS